MKNPSNTKSLLSLCLCGFALTVMFLALWFAGEKQLPFTPPPFEEQALNGTPQVPGDLDWQELDTQAFRVSVCGNAVTNSPIADIWLYNPPTNTVWLKLRILDKDGRLLGETGLIRPGEYLQSLTLTSVPSPGTAIELKIMAYEPETYYSAGAVSLKTVTY